MKNLKQHRPPRFSVAIQSLRASLWDLDHVPRAFKADADDSSADIHDAIRVLEEYRKKEKI